MQPAPASDNQPTKPQLGLFDAVCIIVGIVIGAGIYASPWLIFAHVPNPVMGILVWVIGGALALVGALCYAELATTYPRSGGDYNYLTRAFGRWTGFLFGWAQLAVILTGSIGVYAGAFATRQFFSQFLGVTFGVYEPFPESASFGGLDPLDARDRAARTRTLDRIYDDFLVKAATGRKRTRDEMHER